MINSSYSVANGLSRHDIELRIAKLRTSYPAGLQGSFRWGADVSRVNRLYRTGGRLIDLGGGISAHNGVLAQLGMTVYVIDLLDAYWAHKSASPTDISREVQLLEGCGVRFIPHEISTCDLTNDFPQESIDVVTSFHCIEHLHSSPRLVLESAMRVLKTGGTMLIEVPNAVNARKRFAVLCGHSNYGTYNSFYYSNPFVGHVREYTVDDLQTLAKNLGGSQYRIFGENNTVYGRWVEAIPSRIRTPLNNGLKMFPGLCSSILLEITK